MIVTTSKGKTLPIDWMWGPTGIWGDLMLQYSDTRDFSEIANDFDGVDHFHRESDEEGDMDWDGYTVLKAISRPEYERNPDLVQITLAKPIRLEV